MNKNMQFYCLNCEEMVDVTLTFNDKNELENVTACPKCKSHNFRARFSTDRKNWFGVIGSNG